MDPYDTDVQSENSTDNWKDSSLRKTLQERSQCTCNAYIYAHLLTYTPHAMDHPRDNDFQTEIPARMIINDR